MLPWRLSGRAKPLLSRGRKSLRRQNRRLRTAAHQAETKHECSRCSTSMGHQELMCILVTQVLPAIHQTSTFFPSPGTCSCTSLFLFFCYYDRGRGLSQMFKT
uniref:Uncharacterized protein n=1 Tax=Anguilla anguilla TaxID=7936 RepID=A0A0E9XMA4_ANGAN